MGLDSPCTIGPDDAHPMAFLKAIARLLFRAHSSDRASSSAEIKKQDGVTILG